MTFSLLQWFAADSNISITDEQNVNGAMPSFVIIRILYGCALEMSMFAIAHIQMPMRFSGNPL